jgi:hypothetical protein
LLAESLPSSGEFSSHISEAEAVSVGDQDHGGVPARNRLPLAASIVPWIAARILFPEMLARQSRGCRDELQMAVAVGGGQ